ncbi:MAG: TIGR04076 family protein [bacterium]|nr:TIGR04076 family protein [bacterium]
MAFYEIKCEAREVRTESGVCPGMAKIERGEEFVLGPRTPEARGFCTNSLTAVYPMSVAMRLTDKMDWEKEEHFDIVCPHGAVTYRISRIRDDNK